MNKLWKSIIICSLATLPIYAAIYMRVKGNSKEALVSAGAAEIAKHDVLVNGTKATLTVLAFNEPIESAIEHIRVVHPDFPPLKAGKAIDISGAWISSSDSESQKDLFFLPGLNDAGRCTAWLVEKAPKQTEQEPMPENNPLPDARLTSWLYDKTQNTLLSVHDSEADLNTAFSEAVAALEKDGWIPVSKGETSALMIKNDFPASISVYRTDSVTRTAIVRHL